MEAIHNPTFVNIFIEKMNTLRDQAADKGPAVRVITWIATEPGYLLAIPAAAIEGLARGSIGLVARLFLIISPSAPIQRFYERHCSHTLTDLMENVRNPALRLIRFQGNHPRPPQLLPVAHSDDPAEGRADSPIVGAAPPLEAPPLEAPQAPNIIIGLVRISQAYGIGLEGNYPVVQHITQGDGSHVVNILINGQLRRIPLVNADDYRPFTTPRRLYTVDDFIGSITMPAFGEFPPRMYPVIEIHEDGTYVFLRSRVQHPWGIRDPRMTDSYRERPLVVNPSTGETVWKPIRFNEDYTIQYVDFPQVS